MIEKVAWGDEAADALVLSQVKAEGGKGGGNQEGEGGDGREKVEVVRCEEEGFWFPGFVGKLLLNCVLTLILSMSKIPPIIFLNDASWLH